jgi:hypothetical protein
MHISMWPAIVHFVMEKRLALFETRSNLEKICKMDFKSLEKYRDFHFQTFWIDFIMEIIFKLCITYILVCKLVKQTIYKY